MSNTTHYLLLSFVGMPGSGKTEAAQYLQEKGYAYVRFGDITEDMLREKGLPLTPENEREVRESLRKELGMHAYAEKSLPKIEHLFQTNQTVIVDGLYSWEEYLFLQKRSFIVVVVHVYTERAIRYDRLTHRTVRPLANDEAFTRDVAEIEKLNKSGPIAIADYVVENNKTKKDLYDTLDKLCQRLHI